MSIAVSCEVCGAVEKVPPSRARTYRTCSHACFSILKAGGLPAQSRTCRTCGKVDLLPPSRAAHPFCSSACYGTSLRVPPELRQPRDPEARRISNRKSRAKAVRAAKGFTGDVGDLTTEQWKAVINSYHGRCAYCGEVPAKLSIDHVIPITKGGLHVASNVVPACLSCNQRKRDRLITPSALPEIETLLRGET